MPQVLVLFLFRYYYPWPALTIILFYSLVHCHGGANAGIE